MLDGGRHGYRFAIVPSNEWHCSGVLSCLCLTALRIAGQPWQSRQDHLESSTLRADCRCRGWHVAKGLRRNLPQLLGRCSIKTSCRVEFRQAGESLADHREPIRAQENEWVGQDSPGQLVMVYTEGAVQSKPLAGLADLFRVVVAVKGLVRWLNKRNLCSLRHRRWIRRSASCVGRTDNHRCASDQHGAQ